MGRKREVSPIGTSKFERPYTPPSHSSNTSPTSVESAASRHFGHSSRASTPFEATPSTPATSVANTSFDTRRRSNDPDGWFSDFRDEWLDISDELPDRAQLAAAAPIPVFDQYGNGRTFGSLIDPERTTHERQLILFVRHFYCGACQAYLKAVTDNITMQEYFSIPRPTSIIVIGCGQPHLIAQYKKFTNCPFPIFSDPTRALYKKLGMTLSLNLGRERPEYMKEISTVQWLNGQMKTIKASLRDPEGIKKRDVIKGGNTFQIGGEFLFEGGEAIWCHRMKNYRNHAEVDVLRKLLELDE
ncbi:hypothetical protein K431DRAFT_20842 [Polychaeton citri CBS 116435]|uniref:AhpC-TSA-domain-containing protein n=1 Tax=Polychaeton citri CBS 116435 TaxID=1314669 RepID=A0A9P4PYS1_9PEZI|nr:hypothetical protein K431DRAFT_20842 [Polychaeton citri CBS 116435]